VIDGVPSSALEVVPEEANIVRRIFEAVVDGASQATVARELNARGVKTVRGAAWSQSRVGQTLRNPLYRGVVRHRSDFFAGLHEPIVSDELWQAAERTRTRVTRSRGNGGGRPPSGNHLLTGGLLRCSCGAAMRARTQRKKHGVWEAYLCNGRLSGSTTCKLPAISREEIDLAVWQYFATVGLDCAAMAREWEERRSLRLAELSTRIVEAERDATEAEDRLDRVRRDYLRGALTAEHWQGFKAELEPERQAATAALDRLKANYETIYNEAAAGDSDAATLAVLQEIRDTLAGIVTGSADVPAARQALGRLFESFTLYQYEEAAPEILDADLACGDWYILPTLQTGALLVPRIISEDDDGEPTVTREQQLRRTSIPLEGKLSASPP
jgi:hypothetical protein